MVGGAEFSEEIEKELNAAKAVIVAWSAAAIKSAWVKDEASAAHAQGKMIPVTLDHASPPMGFRQYQVVHFESGHDGIDAPAFQELLRAVTAQLTGKAPVPVEAKSPWTDKVFKPLPLAATGAAVAILAAGIFLVRSGDEERLEKSADLAGESSFQSIDAATEAKTGAIGLAVLPFVNMSSDPEQEYFVDGLSEELLNWLAQINGLNVPGRTSSFYYKGKLDDLRLIGEQLNVKYLLEGSVRRSGSSLRITAQLIEAESGFHLWSNTYDRELADIFAVQEEIARVVVASILGALPSESLHNPGIDQTVDPAAHEYYLAGRSLWTAKRAAVEARERFEKAAEIDPSHALAQAYIAVTTAFGLYNSMPFVTGDANALGDTQAALARAVALRSDLSDVMFAQGYVADLAYGRLQSAEKLAEAKEHYQRAVEANPRNIEALLGLSRLKNDDDREIKLLERILEIDPFMVPARMNMSVGLARKGNWDEAFEFIDRTFDLYPEFPGSAAFLLAKEGGDIERLGAYLLSDLGADQESFIWIARSMLLADFGAIDEASFLLSNDQENARYGPDYLNYFAGVLANDPSLSFEAAKALQSLENAPPYASLFLAQATLKMEEPDRALQIIVDRRPDLLTKMALDPDYDQVLNWAMGDMEAYVAAFALEALGRESEARKIWRAALAQEEQIIMGSSPWRSHFHNALFLAKLGEDKKAIAAFQSAYENGFRFLYSFSCAHCFDTGIVSENGYFASLHGNPEFDAILEKIRKENAETLARYNEQYGVLDQVRAKMAAASKN